MENKYRVGDKVYHGYFTTKDLVVDEYEILDVTTEGLKVRNINYPSAPIITFPQNQDIYFNTYEEAYNGVINRVRGVMSNELKTAEKVVDAVKNRIKKFEDEYGKGELTMDMIVLNLPKAEEVLNVKKEYEDNQLRRWEEFQVNCEARVKEYIKGHLQEWFMACIEQMKKQKMTYTVYDVPIPCNVIWENIRTYKSGYSHDNRCEGYDYKGRQITFEVLDDILKEFNKQKESTHYTSNIYGVTKANYHEGVYYIQGNKSSALGDTKTLHFGCYNSYTIDDVFDGNFYVRISFRVTKED